MRKSLTDDELYQKVLSLLRVHSPIARSRLKRMLSSKDRLRFDNILGKLFYDLRAAKTGKGRKNSQEVIHYRAPIGEPNPPPVWTPVLAKRTKLHREVLAVLAGRKLINWPCGQWSYEGCSFTEEDGFKVPTWRVLASTMLAMERRGLLKRCFDLEDATFDSRIPTEKA
jgi:hypothetical protein